ncbi:HSP20-like chaperone [Mycena olivaceomarginata]|nr:HSP20-like chaperone [Mycena olivaceomarginata]
MNHQHHRFHPYSKSINDSEPVFRLRVEVFDDSNHPNVEAAFEVPGVKPSEINICVWHEVLIIQGQRLPTHCPRPHPPVAPPPTPNTSQPSATHLRPLSRGIRESHYGKFYRALRLPSGADVTKIRAALTNGVLTVTWPREKVDRLSFKVAAKNDAGLL